MHSGITRLRLSLDAPILLQKRPSHPNRKRFCVGFALIEQSTNVEIIETL